MNSETMHKKKRRWKKIIAWGAAGFLVVVLLIVVTGVLLIDHSPEFRQFVLSKVEKSVADSTGATLQVRDFRAHFLSLSLDLYGITVRGTETNPEGPLLQTDRINVGLKILSLLNRKWRVEDIVVDHAVVHLCVDQAGKNNLPQPKTKSGSNANIFDLAIQRFVLERGEIYYNDKKSPLDAELHDVSVNAGFDNARSRYFGDLSYHQGRIQYGDYSPVVHDLQARFDFTPSVFDLDELLLASGASRLSVKAAVDDYSNHPRVQAIYDAVLAGDDFRRLLKNPSVPGGAVRVVGSLNYQSDPNRPLLQAVSLNGQVSSRELIAKTPTVHAQVQDLRLRYKLEGGNADVEDLHGQLLGGTVEGKLVIQDLTGASRARLQTSLQHISLSDLAAATGQQSAVKQAGITGLLNANVNASWAKSLNNLVAHSDVTIQGDQNKGGPSLPINGVIHADYRNAGKQIALNQSYIKTPQTSVTLNGVVSDHSQLQIRMQSADLHELELLAANFSKPASGQAPEPLGLYGTATMNAAVQGSVSNPELTGQLTAANLRVKGSSWKILRTNLSVNPSQVHLSNGDLEAAMQGRIHFELQAGLEHWAYSSSSPIQIQLKALQLSVADLERLAGETYPVEGTLSVNLSAHGSQLNPVGTGEINLVNAKVVTEPVQSVNLHFQGNGEAIDANLAVRLPAGTARAKATYYPKTQGYQVQLQTSNLHLEKLETVHARDRQISGVMNLNASGRGTINAPELTANLEVPELQIRQQTVRGLALNANLRDHTADFSLNSQAAGTDVKANGSVGMDAPHVVNVRVDTGRVPLKPFFEMYMPAQAADMNGETELHATLRGPLQDESKLEAHLEIPVLTATYQQIQLAATKPIHLDYQNGEATLQPTAIQGTDTDIQMQAKIPVRNLKAASYLVEGKIDLGLAQLFEPDIQSSGQLQFDINSQKYAAESNVEGQIKLVNANVQSLDLPLGISNGNAVITVTPDRMDVSSFQAQVGGGTINLKGGVAYRPAVQFALGLNATNVRLRYPDGVRAVLGSTLSLSGSPQAALLSGRVSIEHLSFTNDFDVSTFMNQFSNEAAPPPAPGLAQNIKLNIAVQSTSEMNLSSSQVSVQGSANLRVTGTADNPVILGRTDVTGGEVFVASNRYVIQSGTIDFLNPIETEPVVNVQATTEVNQYNITLRFQGPIERLQTSYTSEPPLPQVDIINLLAFGQTTEAAAANPSPTGVAGGEALLAQGLTSQVTSKVARLAGISNLSIDPGLGGGNNQGNTAARIAIQQRVTSNLFVTFATDVTSTQDQQIEVQYNLNPRWSLGVIRDQNGGVAVDVRHRKSF